MLDDRFWSKAVRAENGCLEWQANKNNKGYGMFSVDSYVGKKLAHRLAYADTHGPIPKGQVVRHKCDNPSCVDPAHLELGTMKDNARDRSERERTGKTDLTNADVVAIRMDYVAGEARKSIAAKYGITIWALDDIIYGRSWKHLLHHPGIMLADLDGVRRRKPGAKVTQEIADTIRKRLATGELGKDLAVEYGIHKATVSEIKTGKIWRG